MSLSAENLMPGARYTCSAVLPLMPTFEPSVDGPVRHIPAGFSFKVRARRMKRKWPWYEVEVVLGGAVREGWVNSIALLAGVVDVGG